MVCSRSRCLCFLFPRSLPLDFLSVYARPGWSPLLSWLHLCQCLPVMGSQLPPISWAPGVPIQLILDISIQIFQGLPKLIFATSNFLHFLYFPGPAGQPPCKTHGSHAVTLPLQLPPLPPSSPSPSVAHMLQNGVTISQGKMSLTSTSCHSSLTSWINRCAASKTIP